MSRHYRFSLLNILFNISIVLSNLINFEERGGVPNDDSLLVVKNNSLIFNSVGSKLNMGDIFYFSNKTFHFMGGLQLGNLNSVQFVIDGNITFSKNIDKWPRNESVPDDCIYIYNSNNLSFSSNELFSGKIDGNGERWWGLPFIGILIRLENRPKLFHLDNVTNILIERLSFTNSPYWTIQVENMNGLIIRNISIINRRTTSKKHTFIDESAFNTDGIDIQGENVHIYDVYIWTQDDCIAVKGNSKNMLFERINASGEGLTIGSIGQEIVNNITFKDCYMENTNKGIYMKFNGAADIDKDDEGLISNIKYENITINNPSEYAIWIGPAQQADSRFICHANPCSLCWPMLSPWAKCNIPRYGIFKNISLRNININYRNTTFINKKYVGVIMGSNINPIYNIEFYNVYVMDEKGRNEERKYICNNVKGDFHGNTKPIPDC